MGKRFYCDYCDKTFPYTTDNRKKHCEGSQHQILRNSYYSNYKSNNNKDQKSNFEVVFIRYFKSYLFLVIKASKIFSKTNAKPNLVINIL